ncbi:MAG: hypothetical protein P1V81_16475 [Planctomycetota bacterium]|nr:hypothetical protein [Planctomycetota bacterium]
MQSTSSPSRPRSRDLLEAVVVAGLATLLFAVAFQDRLFGDGPLQLLSYRRGEATGHALHFQLVAALGAFGLDVASAARAASFLPAGLALGLFHLALTTLGYARSSARVGVLALALTPSAFFFATTIEVHGLQLFGACVGFLLAALVVRPASSLPVRVSAFITAALALALTHPMNAPAGAGLLALAVVGLRSAGVATRRILLAGAALALLALAAGAWMTHHYTQRHNFEDGALLATFTWHPSLTSDQSGLPLPLHNLIEAVVRPVAWLWLPGLLGLAALWRSPARRGLALGLTLWCLPLAVLLAGPEFHERGAYFLAAVPALALGAAELHRVGLAAASSRLGLGLLALVGVSLSFQLAATFLRVRAWDHAPPPEAAEWVAGLREVSQGRGVFLAADIYQQDWSRSWAGLQADNMRLFLALPMPDLEAQARNYALWAEAAAADGEPLWLDSAIIDLAPDLPPLARAVEVLREHFDFTPVTARGFRGYQGLRREP